MALPCTTASAVCAVLAKIYGHLFTSSSASLSPRKGITSLLWVRTSCVSSVSCILDLHLYNMHLPCTCVRCDTVAQSLPRSPAALPTWQLDRGSERLIMTCCLIETRMLALDLMRYDLILKPEHTYTTQEGQRGLPANERGAALLIRGIGGYTQARLQEVNPAVPVGCSRKDPRFEDPKFGHIRTTVEQAVYVPCSSEDERSHIRSSSSAQASPVIRYTVILWLFMWT